MNRFFEKVIFWLGDTNMSFSNIIKLNPLDYEKCNSIWDMKKLLMSIKN